MIRGASTRTHRFLPYRYSDGGLVLVPRRCVLDGTRDVVSAYDEERHLLDLSPYRHDRLRLELAVTLADGVLAGVFPPDERAEPPGRIVVLIRCDTTRLRRHVELEGPLGAGIATVELVHADLIGTVELTPMLVRTRELASAPTEAGYASARGARIASGRPLELRIETLREPHGEFLDVRYESFREKGAPQFPRPDAVYQLECDGEHPILWLNSDHRQICPILDDVANVGRMARLRDLLFDRIQYAVWSRLFLRAARDHAELGEPAYAWEHAVLAKLLPLVYPEIADHESRLAALRSEVAEKNEDDLLARLDVGLQDGLQGETGFGRVASTLAEEIA